MLLLLLLLLLQAKKDLYCSKKKNQSILKLFRENDPKNNPNGETLRQDMQVYWFESFLSAGIPRRLTDYGHFWKNMSTD